MLSAEKCLNFGVFGFINTIISVSIPALPARLMVGQQPLKLFIGVRVPGRQPVMLRYAYG
jgi:hypothetical protein